MRYIIGGAVVALTLTLAGCGGASNDPPAPVPVTTPTVEPAAPAEPAAPEMTVSQEQALTKAKAYIGVMPFSRQGLIDQLVFDQFPVEDATFAVDNLGADWTAEAAKKAQSYIDLNMGFSHQGMVDQLVFEKWTPEEAEAGTVAVGL